MTMPKELIEWAIWAHLDDHKDPQLVLLKGHLLLDVLLTELIKDKNLSFYGKVHKFASIYESAFVSNSLFELNRIRNKMAHEWEFKVEESGLPEWSNNILENISYEAPFHRTFRTKIVHAFAALAGELYKYQRINHTNHTEK